jgi:type IV secretory pathway VirB2 component (pilin)
MKTTNTAVSHRVSGKTVSLDNVPKGRLIAILSIVLLVAAVPAFAQSNPWESAVTALQTSMTGPIAKGLALVAIVVGGMMFAFGEGGSKKMLSGIIFGLGMALGAVNFMSWLFPAGS